MGPIEPTIYWDDEAGAPATDRLQPIRISAKLFMLKRIGVHQLTLGMYLKEFCGSWMEHPFWRSSFVLTDPKDLEAILASSIKEVWIDTSRGLDVPAAVTAVLEAESEADIDATLTQVAPRRQPTAQQSIEQEMARATKICDQARQAVVTMFEEVRMGHAVDTEGTKALVGDIADSVARNPGALISLARLKSVDDYTYLHSVAVCALMVALARQLGLEETQVRSAGMAGLLHDLGKALMPLDILNKPGKLTAAEFEVIRNHPEAGYRILLKSENIDAISLDVCLHHHEKMDGSGYPKGFKGDEISLLAKMGAVCDVYDAITSNRPYKAGWDPAEALRKMAEWSKGHFDPVVFQAFVKSMGIYPIGSLVQLSSGRIGVVTEQAQASLVMPRVKVFFSTKSNMRISPELVDLSRRDNTERVVGREDPEKWGFPDLDALWSGLDIVRH
jgi:putative nucleotidyltransferase with HDIG domain